MIGDMFNATSREDTSSIGMELISVWFWIIFGMENYVCPKRRMSCKSSFAKLNSIRSIVWAMKLRTDSIGRMNLWTETSLGYISPWSSTWQMMGKSWNWSDHYHSFLFFFIFEPLDSDFFRSSPPRSICGRFRVNLPFRRTTSWSLVKHSISYNDLSWPNKRKNSV